MKDDCYRLDLPTGGTIEAMIRKNELWLDVKNMSGPEQYRLLESGEEVAIDPTGGITYVRANYYARICPEIQTVVNDLARKMNVKLPCPEN